MNYEHVPLKRVRGFSLTRPWPWAFMNGPVEKRVENRSWPCPAGIMQHVQIALHAAKSWSEGDRIFISEVAGIECPPKAEHQDSIIYAVCRVDRCVTEYQDVLPAAQRHWFFGPYGWMLSHFVKLIEPVPCKGAQGLWGFENKQVELANLREVYEASKGTADI